jgi:hypothetical protein
MTASTSRRAVNLIGAGIKTIFIMLLNLRLVSTPGTWNRSPLDEVYRTLMMSASTVPLILFAQSSR